MRTIVIIGAGLTLFGVFALVGWRFVGGSHFLATAAKAFIPLWLGAALLNMWIGVSRAGYSVAEEFPIFVLIFAIPAAVAAVVWWKS
jgi:hypothetical protein